MKISQKHRGVSCGEHLTPLEEIKTPHSVGAVYPRGCTHERSWGQKSAAVGQTWTQVGLVLHLLVLAVTTAIICFAEVVLPHSVMVVTTSSRRAPLLSAPYDIRIMIPASSDTGQLKNLDA